MVGIFAGIVNHDNIKWNSKLYKAVNTNVKLSQVRLTTSKVYLYNYFTSYKFCSPKSLCQSLVIKSPVFFTSGCLHENMTNACALKKKKTKIFSTFLVSDHSPLMMLKTLKNRFKWLYHSIQDAQSKKIKLEMKFIFCKINKYSVLFQFLHVFMLPAISGMLLQ